MSAEKDERYLWPEYYEEFPCFSEESIRPGCQPRKLLHSDRTGKAIVLVHGLTDSPFYMTAIAEYFHNELGYNVYLPLLQGHGLKDPDRMAGVSLTQWKKNVRFAIRTATENADQLSMGGLSTGGALSLYFACTDPEVTGDIFLFSVALGLYGGYLGFFGGLVEFLLRLPFFRLFDNKKSLIGSHPYRYDRVPLNSAGELARLISEINGLVKTAGDIIFTKRIFAAWSEFDEVVNVKKIDNLQFLTKENQFTPFTIPRAAQVDHVDVVLNEPVYAIDSRKGDVPLESANPVFAEMMTAMRSFESTA